MHLSAYRIMWILVLFDLPTDTKKRVKDYSKFHKFLLEDGFSMFQFSIYARHCSSKENMQVHINRVKSHLPPEGEVAIFKITDKQFESIDIYKSSTRHKKQSDVEQLEFDFY